MTVAINGATGTTTPGTTFTGSTSGSILVQAPATAGTNTLTLPANTGTIVSTGSSAVVTQAMLASSGIAGNGPAFSAFSPGTETFTSGVPEKITLSEDIDTNTDFATSRFTPTVAGYYFISGTFGFSSSTNLAQYATCYIQKNGNTAYLNFGGEVSAGTTAFASTSGLIYCNGTTDYIELWGRATASGGTLTASVESNLSGFLARSA